MIDIGYLAGWIGLGFGSLVAPPQLYRMIKTGRSRDVSLTTYVFLFVMMTGYLVHAIYISAPVFIVAQIWGLTINGMILIILIKRKIKYGDKKEWEYVGSITGEEVNKMLKEAK